MALDDATLRARPSDHGSVPDIRNRHDSLLRDADERLFGEHVRSQDVQALRRIVTGVLDSLERRDTHG